MAEVGRRLWVRSPNFEWIVLPVGAGEDNYLRSLNVYDGERERWMTPAPFNAIQVANALDVRAPDTTWTDTPYGDFNPTWNWQVDDHYTTVPDDYVRLSYMRPRNDPTWRMANVGVTGTYPVTTPSLPVHGTALLDPLGGDVEENTEYLESSTVTTPPSGYALVQDGGLGAHIPGLSQSKTLDTPNNIGFRTRGAGMVDLRSITEQLAARWLENDYGVGQYQPLTDMHIRRVEIGGTVTMVLSHSAGADFDTATTPDLLDEFEAFRALMYVGVNNSGIEISEWAYTPRYPQDATPYGTAVYEQQGLPGDIQIDEFSAKYRLWQHHIGLVIESDDLDFGNINFSFAVDDVIEPGALSASMYHIPTDEFITAPYPAVVRVETDFRVEVIFIHYSVSGHDVPEPFRFYPDGDFGTGVYVMDE